MKREYKKVYDPTRGKYVRKHVYGEGFTDIFGRIISGLTGKVAKDVAQKAAVRAAEASAQKLGEKAGTALGERLFNEKKGKKDKMVEIQKIPTKQEQEKEIAGDKIIEYLRTKSKPKTKAMTDYEINERVNNLLARARSRGRT